MSATHPPAQEKAAPGSNRAAANGNQEHAKPSTIAGQGKRSFDPETLESLRCRLFEYLTKIGVELRKNGSRLVGRCPVPVHADTDPSFAVFGDGHEKCGCHPCGFTGDVFAVSEWMGRSTSFTSAVREVAATLGVYLPQDGTQAATRTTAPPQRAAKVEVPFVLSDADKEKIHAAKLAWSDAFHGGDSIVGFIAEDLGLTRETLRYAGHGSSGLGIANGWLCYAYPSGLKFRNPDPQGKPRFVWLCGKCVAPWRAEWMKLPGVDTVYLTEGETDCLALIEAGLEADGSACCVASPGTSFSAEWASLFQGKRVVLCFDSDTAGQAASAKVAAMLAPHATSVSIWNGGAQ